MHRQNDGRPEPDLQAMAQQTQCDMSPPRSMCFGTRHRLEMVSVSHMAAWCAKHLVATTSAHHPPERVSDAKIMTDTKTCSKCIC